MKHISKLLCILLMLCAASSCIKDEPLNAECDITGVEQAWLDEHKDILVGTPILTNDHVAFNIKKGTDRSQLSPLFTLTEGARITALVDGTEVEGNGLTRNFSSPQTYTVHSQDGQWHKNYTVVFNFPRPIETMSFEHFALESTGRYQTWFEVDPTDTQNPQRNYWASGNGGYALVGIAKQPADYPTASDPLGVQGNCIKLVTRRTGSFGDMVKMPIAAGNLFIGTFDTKIAMKEPRNATHFGLPLVQDKPVLLKGYYKYTRGEVFTDKNKKVCPERKDTADIYAVIYECDPQNFVALNGDEVLSSPRIVMMARINNPGEPQEWEEFYVPFKSFEGRSIDMERLKSGKYAIAVVATSSRQGAYFEGAIGSVLWVDELRVVWQLDDDADEQRTKMEQYLETHPDER